MFLCGKKSQKMQKKKHPKEKSALHPRNRHRQRYNFQELIKSCPALKPYVRLNDYQDESINFFDPAAVKMLNTALLKHYYDLKYWDIPSHYLCPPIPGRADYIHHLADLLSQNQDSILKGSHIKCLDIGTGANCVYPIIGNKEYDWSFIGSDIDPTAIESAKKIIQSNPTLKGKIDIRLQQNKNNIFQGILQKNEYIDCSICNPPFHASLAEAQAGSRRKLRNLTQQRNKKIVLNFGGQSNELWCQGGEKKFIQQMIFESQIFAQRCCWFTTLISQKTTLNPVYKLLKKVNAKEVKTIQMGQGNKVSRLVGWTFLTTEERKQWSKKRWQKYPFQ